MSEEIAQDYSEGRVAELTKKHAEQIGTAIVRGEAELATGEPLTSLDDVVSKDSEEIIE